jgi:branched-chain amino acid aminotransferase
LYAADEVFISSTTRQVQPVEQIEEHHYAQAPGPLTTRLARLFDEYVKQSAAQATAVT